MQATALIAEDEPLLAAHLHAELQRLWPELRVLATVGDGASALRECLALAPDVVFLDIRMPGMNGLDAAQALAEDWPDGDAAAVGAPPLVVFVTAYDEYAVRAFERAALDYVLKPVQPERLARTCERLREALSRRSTAPDRLEPLVTQLRGLLGIEGEAAEAGVASGVEPLRMIQASAGNTITMIPVDEVLFFESADKYVRVVTADREHLIRLSLRDLLQRLDAQTFWQIHRGTVVRADAIASASRDEAGKLTLRLRGHEARLVVSRLYADRFKGM
ncbi:DNA-binding LytR/AlgR family response regulator [Paraburkholderia bannensis]|uniref:DNA-binding LytR/AlgR family response regulator n=1 Tax=Paraburkholderia bannensis TaxID=765414 RepID=A0A7W9WUW8_9BURK|nr:MULTISPECIES: LytTR family DNA-binding domain-containing protein [Paraburkholderia]MBB3259889.1 DNA-binding LytR/AlgR family response regulator [Paraburkholderia sp. WP4_3_2]MBB6104801.1 DNA-binding LytR/AlgR family response regulator [Paraburkholderia bannensis]